MFALGAGHRIVAVTDFCDYPAEVSTLPKVGGYINPALETMTMLQPELILLPGQHPRVAEYAREAKISVLNVHMDSLETIEAGIRTIGARLDCRDEAASLWEQISTELKAVRESVSGRPRPKVLVINTRSSHDLNSLFTVGALSFLSELTDIAGGDNLFRDDKTDYFEASKESVVLREPDVIIEFHAGENLSAEESSRFIADWSVLTTVPAVRHGRIYLFHESYGLRPGPRIGQTARDLAGMLHPDVGVAAP
ncbi:MAG: hypothetical protein AMXMBFR84_05180 [Candidatus Hydrogenedentota bacterium]